MKKFIIRNIYSTYVSKQKSPNIFTRNQNDIRVFENKESAEKFIQGELKDYPFDDLEIVRAHF